MDHDRDSNQQNKNENEDIFRQQQQISPTPVMPSQLFQQLALSQLELLDSALSHPDTTTTATSVHNNTNHDDVAGGGIHSVKKVHWMALYLPQENMNTGQLEFLPAVIYPRHATRERVFIANDADSGVAPTLPKTLTKLPGFAHANSLLPQYPMVSTTTTTTSMDVGGIGGRSSSTAAGVGVVEEVLWDLQQGDSSTAASHRRQASVGGAALSVPLFSGSQTVGVLLVSPSNEYSSISRRRNNKNNGSVWTAYDREQVANAAKSLSLALAMDTERITSNMQNERLVEALSDSMHQVKNPLQALRTYGKILQRKIAEAGDDNDSMIGGQTASSSSAAAAGSSSSSSSPSSSSSFRTSSSSVLELAEHLLIQSDRLADRLKPVDALVDSFLLTGTTTMTTPPALNPYAPTVSNLVFPTTSSSSSSSTQQRRNQEEKQQLQEDEQQRQQRGTDSRPPLTNGEEDEARKESPSVLIRSGIPFASPYSQQKHQSTIGKQRSDSQQEEEQQQQQHTTWTSGSGVRLPMEENGDDERKILLPDGTKSSSSSKPNGSDESMLDRFNLEMAFVDDVLDPIFTAFRAIASENGVSFVVQEAQELPGIFISPLALQEVVSNVLDNAFKYVMIGKSSLMDGSILQQNSSPQVRVRMFANKTPEHSGPGVTIMIEDNGPGIRPEEVHAIFQRGIRGMSTSSSVPGTGLGLSIAKTLVNKMGGTIRAVIDNDSVGGGCVSSDTIALPSISGTCLDGGVIEIVLFRRW